MQTALHWEFCKSKPWIWGVIWLTEHPGWISWIKLQSECYTRKSVSHEVWLLLEEKADVKWIDGRPLLHPECGLMLHHRKWPHLFECIESISLRLSKCISREWFPLFTLKNANPFKCQLWLDYWSQRLGSVTVGWVCKQTRMRLYTALKDDEALSYVPSTSFL